MLKVLLYGVILLAFIVLGLAIGAANDAVVNFDYLLASSEVSVAVVLVSGVVAGVLMGIYISLIFCFRMWRRAHAARAELSRMRRIYELKSGEAGETEAQKD